MNIPTIKTTRFTLRPLDLGDADALCAILHEPDILKYFPNPAPPSKEKVEKYISHQLAHWSEFSYGHWAVKVDEDSTAVGWMGLEYLPELKETELAYLLSHRVWGQGIATAGAHAALDYGFEHSGLDAIIGLVHPENLASIHVLEKSGFAFADSLTIWGMGMARYRISVADHQSKPLP